MNELKNKLFRFMNDYGEIFNEVYKTKKYSHPYSKLITQEIPSEILLQTQLDKNKY